MQDRGFLELEHTADWALKVWAPDLQALLVTAAEGMYALSKIKTDPGKLQQVEINLNCLDPESLLVEFLSELLFWAETDNFAVIEYELKLDQYSLFGQLGVVKILNRQKEIKAVTFHNLKVIQNENGVETVIIFDV